MSSLKLLDFVETPAFAMVFQEGNPTIVFWNARAEALTGLERAEVLGKPPTMALGSLAAPLASATWTEDAGQVDIEGFGTVKLAALPDGKTVIGIVVGAAQKIDDEEREVFLGMATHDLRAPLRNIANICEELLVEFPDPGDGRNRLVRLIRGVSDRSLAMTEEILTAVQADALQDSQCGEVALQPLSDLIFATLDPSGRHRLKSVEATLVVERPVLQIVLRNLVDNAIRHGAGESALNIQIGVTEVEDGMLAVAVSDDGHGFTKPSLASLTGKDMRNKAGFGLYGVRRLLRARGGRVTVATRAPEKGSVVTFTLPGRLLGKGAGVARAS